LRGFKKDINSTIYDVTRVMVFGTTLLMPVLSYHIMKLQHHDR